MQRLPEMELAQRAIRTRVCTQCFKRPVGSERLSADRPRVCEGECTIFLNLPKLQQIAESIHDATMGPYESAMRDMVCQECAASPTSGDYCEERRTVQCPLARYAPVVIETLERLVAAR